MKGEEEFFPKGAVWYCAQCKSVGNLEVLVWVSPAEMEVSHLSDAFLSDGYEGWCHNCDEEVVVKRDLPRRKANAS
jgi:hypothetical protein